MSYDYIMKAKEPLYRKMNTTTRMSNNHENFDTHAKYDRGTKLGISRKMNKPTYNKMNLDYTPLFRFLLSRVGKKWDDVYSEAVSRLDIVEPIWWMVCSPNTFNKIDNDDRPYFQVENGYHSKLKVDEDGLLQLVKPDLKNEDFTPYCGCCTYTFNGKPLNNKYDPERGCQPAYNV